MNWRNPFLITYLSVTVVGTAALGYFLYSSYNHSVDVDAQYTDAVGRLQSLQNRAPFPSKENNAQYVEFTQQYRAEYDKLLAKVAGMQKPVAEITPQGFQDLLRSNVSQVLEAAKENGVVLPPEFYLGFDQYRGALPSDGAAGPLARELGAIRLVVDQLLALKVQEIRGIERQTLSEENGSNRQAAAPRTPPRTGPGNTRQPAGASSAPAQKVVNADAFTIEFVANQSSTRAALNFVANSDQFFIIRSLNVENSSMEGPKKIVDDPAAVPPTDPSQPAGADSSKMRLIAGRETLAVTLKIEMITFNIQSSDRK